MNIEHSSSKERISRFSSFDMKILIESFRFLPSTESFQKMTTDFQKNTWYEHQKKWRWTLERIVYIEHQKLGLSVTDPFETGKWRHEYYKMIYIAHGDLYYSILQLIIKGYEFIWRAAEKEGLEFGFSCPREFFFKICLDTADYAIDEVFGSKDNVTAWRNELNRESHFFRGRIEDTETEEILNALKKEGWIGFWIYAIWNHRLVELKKEWNDFLKCHKAINRLAEKKNLPKGLSILLKHWKKGYPYSPKSGGLIE